MVKKVKLIFFHLSKALGLFRLARHITRKRLRILCYHGIVLEDEHLWHPKMFIRQATFRKRLTYLQAQHFPILALEQALTQLSEGRLPAGATVITFDEGLFSTKVLAHPVLMEKAFPYTIYVTSYYCIKQTPICNLVLPYMFWKTSQTELNLADLNLPQFKGVISLNNPRVKSQTLQRLIEYGHACSEHRARVQLMQRVGTCLGVDYAHLEHTRLLSLCTAAELSELAADGVDLQLHSHRHRWPLEQQAAIQEILPNQAYLEPLTGKPVEHFCYPGGAWTPEQFPYLEMVGIKSATTCEPWLNDPATPRLRLNRFLDGENLHQIEFEALMCGYVELLKQVLAVFSRKD